MRVGLVLIGLIITSSISNAQHGRAEFDSFLEAYTTTWNTHDGDALSLFFAADAELIMGSLPRITGREAIGSWWKTYFSRIDENRKGAFDLVSLRDIAPGAIIVNLSSKTFGTDRNGTELETRLARGTWVLVKRNEKWEITAMLGLPAEGEQRLRPGVDR